MNQKLSRKRAAAQRKWDKRARELFHLQSTPENITYARIDTDGTVWTTVGRVDYWWASICSMHRNYNAQCKLCRNGRWVADAKRTPESYRTTSTGDLPDMEIPTR